MFKLKNKLMMGGGMGNACNIYAQGNQPALGNFDVQFQRNVFMNGGTTMDDGKSVIIWGFNGRNLDANGNDITPPTGGNNGGGGGMMGGGGGGAFPAPPMRLRERQVAHSVLNATGMGGGGGMNGMSMWSHTIHHHGIEPEYRSDGVGHTSWDVSNTYTYQWTPQHAGTYFYHCHTNTVLHPEMGMYGVLIVDPADGSKTAFSGGPAYDIEAIWAVDEFDTSWHKSASNWPAGTCGGDVGLNKLNPDYFLISGADGSGGQNSTASTDPRVAVTMTRGQRLLARYIHAGYLPQQLRIPNGLSATIVASDGRPYPNQNIQSLNTVAAERYDIMITANNTGTFFINFDILDWITGARLGTATTRVTVV